MMFQVTTDFPLAQGTRAALFCQLSVRAHRETDAGCERWNTQMPSANMCSSNKSQKAAKSNIGRICACRESILIRPETPAPMHPAIVLSAQPVPPGKLPNVLSLKKQRALVAGNQFFLSQCLQLPLVSELKETH